MHESVRRSRFLPTSREARPLRFSFCFGCHMAGTIICVIEGCKKTATLIHQTPTREWGLCIDHAYKYGKFKQQHEKGVENTEISKRKVYKRSNRVPSLPPETDTTEEVWSWTAHPFHWTTLDGKIIQLSGLAEAELIGAIQTIVLYLGAGTPLIPTGMPKILDIVQKSLCLTGAWFANAAVMLVGI